MSYWEDRQSRLLEDVVSTSDNTSKEIAEVYFDASFYINSKLQDIFGRYKNKHGLTDKEALILLNQMNDPTSYSELLKKLKGSKGEDRKELLKILEAPAFRHRIRRLEELQKEIDHVMHSVYNQEKNISTLNYVDVANESYYRTMYNLEKELNQSIGFTGVSEKHINSILNGKWSGKNYSKRIWNNTTTLANELKRNLLLGIVAGKTEKEMTQEILGIFQVGNFRARRLVETESVYVSTMMDIEAFKEADVEVMRFVATHDLRTSKICREHDSKLVRVSKAVPGVNVPPLHPHCRSFMIPVIDDELNKKLQRRNKNEDGSYETVDANETYKQWYERKVNSDYDGTVEVNHKRRVNVISDKEQYERYKRVLGDEYVPDTFEKFQDMKYNDVDKWKKIQSKYRIVNQYQNHTNQKMNPKKILELHRNAYSTKRDLFTSKFKKSGNIGVMELDGEIYYAHSAANSINDPAYKNYKGDKSKLILKPEKQTFITRVIGSHDRNVDSEYKLFEYASSIAEDGKKHKLYLLSEISSCDSCKEVLEQFVKKYPNVEVSMVSTKDERMKRKYEDKAKEVYRNVWKK